VGSEGTRRPAKAEVKCSLPVTCTGVRWSDGHCTGGAQRMWQAGDFNGLQLRRFLAVWGAVGRLLVLQGRDGSQGPVVGHRLWGHSDK